MRLIGRLFLIALALPFAIAAGLLALALVAVLDPVMAELAGTVLQAGFEALLDAIETAENPGPWLDDAAYGASRLAFMLLVLPVAFVALAGEAIGARSLFWHAGGTALVTAAVPWLARGAVGRPTPQEIHVAAMLAIVGAAAGFVYWLIAGGSAGAVAVPSSSDERSEIRGPRRDWPR